MSTSLPDEIRKLQELKDSGALSQEEFQRAKESLLRKNQSTSETISRAVNDVSFDANTWGMFIHLSQFCGYLMPFAGLIVPIVLWQIKKNDSEIIDRHGRLVANWIITELIYGLVGALLCMIFIGVPLLMVLAVIAIAFPIIGGIKAKNGEVWRYPFTITFFLGMNGQAVRTRLSSRTVLSSGRGSDRDHPQRVAVLDPRQPLDSSNSWLPPPLDHARISRITFP